MSTRARSNPQRARVVAAMALALASACSGKACAEAPTIHDEERRPPHRAKPDVDVCPTYATSYCARLVQCTPLLADFLYGDEARCRQALTAYCSFELHAPGSGDTPAILADCRDAFPAIRCEDWVVGLFPRACDPPGARPNGAPCGLRAQCASYQCDKGAFDAPCGVCAPLPLVGAACLDGHCARGLVCDASKRCRPPGALGASCTRDDDCVYGLGCNAGGTCGRTAPMGAPCTPHGAIDCDHRLGAYCAGTPARCTAYRLGTPGDPCAARLECAGGYCDGSTHRCAALGAIGDACDPIEESPCLYPGVCVAGKCATPDLTRCR